jgi:plastocyanin
VTSAAADVEYTGRASLSVNGDADTSNNQSNATTRGLLSSPLIGAFMDYTDDSCMDHLVSGVAVTNRTSIELRGKAAPNQIIAILIGLVQVGATNSDANGNFAYSINLTKGVHEISARYANQVQDASTAIISPRDPASGLPTGKLRLLVNPALPYDPMSACLTDSNGRSIFLPTLGLMSTYNQAETLSSSILKLKEGESYRMSLYGNGNQANSALDAGFTLADDLINEVLPTRLKDLDGDGLFSGQITLPKPIPTPLATTQADGGSVQAAAIQANPILTLIVNNNGVESSYQSEVGLASNGVVGDRVTNQPVANASLVALLAQNSATGVVYITPASATLGQANPITTASDGSYRFTVPNGIYRLDVLASGYQPYRTGDIEVTDGQLAQNIALSPIINEAPTQRILVTAEGFRPAQVTVTPGSVVEFVNVDLADHSINSAQWESGVLSTGDSYQVKFTTLGAFAYSDGLDVTSTATITVENEAPAPDSLLYLPLVQR